MEEPRADPLLYFGCGALLGFFLVFVGLVMSSESSLTAVLWSAAAAVVFGLLSVRWGGRFWYRILQVLSWW